MCDCSSLNSHLIPGNLSSRRLRHHGPSRCYTKARSPRDLVWGRCSEVVLSEPSGRRGRLPVEGSRVARKNVTFSGYPDPLPGGRFPFKSGGRNPIWVSRNSGDYLQENSVFSSRVGEGGAENVDPGGARMPQKDGGMNNGDTSAQSGFDVLELKRELEKEEREARDRDRLELESNPISSEDLAKVVSDSEEENRVDRVPGSRFGRRMLRRSSLLAKQVISVQSARSLGFISELWVDATSWIVVMVEVKPNLLSGEIEKLLLEDVHQVGDVVLVQDESVMENELKMIGLNTLVGCNVVTSRRRNIGKVSTYCLMVDDVIEIVSDTVVVHEDAASRLQRLTKGFWDTRTVESSWDDIDEFSNLRRRTNRPVRRRRSGNDFKFQDDWDIPMDF
uniref:Fanconi-associated nuclease 1 n=1 Tax=Anthurium amnicola TaxID=1678845 RepID=A0A1D1Y818_9ARAE